MSVCPIDVEGKLRFAFDQRWNAVKWDDAREFADGLGKHQHTNAVDIIATLDDRQLWLIEVKDPRGHHVAFKEKLKNLHAIVADKARDTLAGAIWSIGRFENSDVHRLLRPLLLERDEKVGVVLWLEGVDRTMVSVIQAKIEQQLSWMKPRVLVTSRELFGAKESKILQGVKVTSLKGAPAKP